jgi:hypothetical protein
MTFSEVQSRARQLPWASLAALILASGERALAYREAYLRLQSTRDEFDITQEPDLRECLDRGWAVVRGDSPLPPVAFGFDGELTSLWGALAGAQIKAYVFDLVEGVVNRGSAGHLQTLLRSALAIFGALQEFADDGFIEGPRDWPGPESEERKALTSDLEWLEKKGSSEDLLELRNRWRAYAPAITLSES